LIPVQAEYLAMEGMSRLLDTINLVRQGLNLTLSIEGVLITMYSSRLSLAQQVPVRYGATSRSRCSTP